MSCQWFWSPRLSLASSGPFASHHQWIHVLLSLIEAEDSPPTVLTELLNLSAAKFPRALSTRENEGTLRPGPKAVGDQTLEFLSRGLPGGGGKEEIMSFSFLGRRGQLLAGHHSHPEKTWPLGCHCQYPPSLPVSPHLPFPRSALPLCKQDFQVIRIWAQYLSP